MITDTPIEDDSSTSSDFGQSRVNKRKRNRVVLNHKWIEEEIRNLIDAVESRPPLWDTLNAQYKNRSAKDLLWKEISESVFKDEIPHNEIHTKWDNLRVQFNRCDIDIQSTKSGQGAENKKKWLYYDALSFIKNNTASTGVLQTITNFVSTTNSNKEKTTASIHVSLFYFYFHKI